MTQGQIARATTTCYNSVFGAHNNLTILSHSVHCSLMFVTYNHQCSVSDYCKRYHILLKLPAVHRKKLHMQSTQ